MEDEYPHRPHSAGVIPAANDELAVVALGNCAHRVDAKDCQCDADNERSHASNEKEISHGRVWWQTRWTYFGMGPLASSIG
jgi:hypothetical protein